MKEVVGVVKKSPAREKRTSRIMSSPVPVAKPSHSDWRDVAVKQPHG